MVRLLAQSPGSIARCWDRSGPATPAILDGAEWSREVTATTPAVPVPFPSTARACAVCLHSWPWPEAHSLLASASPPSGVGATPVVVHRDSPAWAPRYEESF